ncbi:hypothetical protein [Roseateles violae]|uniref:Uncharacterized protein n=1 Tax=Roseateles violae TaxID=3058042 RepID=A0ABT8DYN5_9BURK|nr:hypothetical protein [Pelomonas sp. PFR6]MDN3922690.1 hypothetical protein [Pelomonas sp. PFR6]
MSKFIAPRPLRLSLRTSKPRNPLVGPSLLRQAGRHADGNARQAARRDLLKQIQQLGQPDRSP